MSGFAEGDIEIVGIDPEALADENPRYQYR
jgi:hypothetical protein